jgi:hypothetical protein
MIRLAVHLEVSLEELMNDYKNKEVVKWE